MTFVGLDIAEPSSERTATEFAILNSFPEFELPIEIEELKKETVNKIFNNLFSVSLINKAMFNLFIQERLAFGVYKALREVDDESQSRSY